MSQLLKACNVLAVDPSSAPSMSGGSQLQGKAMSLASVDTPPLAQPLPQHDEK